VKGRQGLTALLLFPDSANAPSNGRRRGSALVRRLQEFRELERLVQRSPGTQELRRFQGGHGPGRQAGHDNERHRRMFVSQGDDEIDAVSGHEDVGNHDIGGLFAEEPDGFLPGSGPRHMVTRTAERGFAVGQPGLNSIFPGAIKTAREPRRIGLSPGYTPAQTRKRKMKAKAEDQFAAAGKDSDGSRP